jgi:hypothetical protein
MTKEFEALNEKYNDETYPVFPFISKTRITPLPKGLYRKHKANYRGITAVFNTTTQEYEFPLFGMYFIPENLVIVPPEMEMTEAKQKFLNASLQAGFKQTDKAPHFQTYKFDPTSDEAKLALINKVSHQYSVDEAIGYELVGSETSHSIE